MSNRVEAIAELASVYRASHNMAEPSEDFDSVVALPSEQTAPYVAQYLAVNPDADITWEAFESYNALANEIREQWEFLAANGYTYSVVDSDPYVTSKGAPNSLAMMRDVRDNKHISVLATAITGEHSFFSNMENDLFRAVHDIFGHAATGRNFSANGEESAYRHHRTMFSNKAIPALTTETRVQNSLNNSNGNSFVAQRATIIDGAEKD